MKGAPPSNRMSDDEGPDEGPEEEGPEEEGDEGEEGDEDAPPGEGPPEEGVDRAGPGEAARRDRLLEEANAAREMRIVPEEERVTSDRLQLTELAQLLAMRARMIEKGQPCYTETGETHPVRRALEELKAGRCPLKLLRHVGEEGDANLYEAWDVNAMAIPELPGEP